MARRRSRIIAFQAIYSWDVNGSAIKDLLDFSWVDEPILKKIGEDSLNFIRLLITGVVENIDDIDDMIKKHLTNWDFNRLNKVDLAVLRISVYPLMFQKDIHPSIVIDEAIDIVKEFGADDSFKFVNAVLDSIKNSVARS